MDCNPPGSSVYGILQARILEWVAIPFPRGSSWLSDQTQVSCIAGRSLPFEPPEKPFSDENAIMLDISYNLSWRRQWHPTPVLLPGKSHGWMSLGGCSPWGVLRVRHDWTTSLSLFTFTHWRRKWQPTPVFLPGESHGEKSLEGYSPWGCKESDTTERLTHTHTPYFIISSWGRMVSGLSENQRIHTNLNSWDIYFSFVGN